MAHYVVWPQKKLISRIFKISGALIVITEILMERHLVWETEGKIMKYAFCSTCFTLWFKNQKTIMLRKNRQTQNSKMYSYVQYTVCAM